MIFFSLSTSYRCATRYAEVADSVVLVLLDFLGGDGGYDVMQCVKSIVEQYPNFRYGGMSYGTTGLTGSSSSSNSL